MDNLQDLLTSGGDERIQLKENGLNKNFINPTSHDRILFRGSCTCSTLNNESHPRLLELIEEVKKDGFEQHVMRQRQSIKELAGEDFKDSFEVFFAPSGTGLNYFGLLFSSILNPETDIHNIITCPEELGSGTPNAASGKFFSQLNQFGESVEKGERLSENLNVFPYYFSARDEDGNILNHRTDVLDKLNELKDEASVIGNLVIGSKSGIEENATIIPRSPKNTLWVIDMCQLRAPTELINRLISLGAMVMITGSKFYQAPPYCGALLVPKKFLDTLPQDRDASIYEPFNRIFSQNDIPESLPWMRKHFRKFNNYGLLLRWESAIYEMDKISKVPVQSVMNIVDQWHDTIVDLLQKNSSVFELMPDGEVTNKTIISFRVKKKDGSYFTEPELRELYKAISLNNHGELKNFDKLIIGQPVKYLDKAFIRLALGSYSVRKMVNSGIDKELETAVIDVIKRESLKFQ